MQRVTVLADGFAWNGKTYPSLSKVAFAITGTRWNGPRFFGLRDKPFEGVRCMKRRISQMVRCAIYTRVSTDQGSIKTSTRSTPSMKPHRPISAAKPTPAGR